MRRGLSEFSLERDRALGAALRAALDRPGDASFASAVLARARAAGVGSSRAVLARWTRAAVVAAIVAAVVGGALGRTTPASTSYDAAWVSAATGSSVAAAFVTAERPPDASVLFAYVVED